jgi:hypothetical protein
VSLSARRCLVRACVEISIEEVSIAAVVESRVSGDAQEVSLAVARLLVESVLGEAKALNFGILGALEAQIAGGIAVSNYVGPVTVVRLGVEGQTLGTFEEVTAAVDAVQELIALVGRVAHSEISELMWTVVGRLSGLKNGKITTAVNLIASSGDYLQIRSAGAVNVDGILARIGEQTRFLVES